MPSAVANALKAVSTPLIAAGEVMVSVKSLSQHDSVAEWLARRTRDLVVAGSIPNQAML